MVKCANDVIVGREHDNVVMMSCAFSDNNDNRVSELEHIKPMMGYKEWFARLEKMERLN